MGTSLLKPILLASSAAFFSLSCKTNMLPKVERPTYQSYNIGTEKGYKVEFELSNNNAQPIAVILNNIQQKITPENKNDLKYHVNVIAQSQKIFGFKPTVVKKENGLIFKTDSAEVYQPVKFELKTK